MKLRLLRKGYDYQPQIKRWYWPVWTPVTDDIREADYETLERECYASPLDVESSFVSRFIREHKCEYSGIISADRLCIRIRLIHWLSRTFGIQGPPGMMGAKGDKGEHGRNAPALDDVECPHCLKRRTDEPRQRLFVKVKSKGFLYKCNKCDRTTYFHVVNGFPAPGTKGKQA